uniref:BTB domain-containing protein n=1 Tax=Biomphalaria glabrata TaxID=6526 RepID=A0A2C9LNY4_BIOGL
MIHSKLESVYDRINYIIIALYKVGTQVFYCHKFILANSSEVFKVMMYSSCWPESKMSEIILREHERHCKQFEKFLAYFYKSEVTVCQKCVDSLIFLADKYLVGNLKNLCVTYMAEQVRHMSIQRTLEWFKTARFLCLEDLSQKCLEIICWNSYEVVESPDWKNLDKELVLSMLKNSDLVIQGEYTLFLALLNWLTERTLAHASELLPFIRFSQMKVYELQAVKNSILCQDKELKSLIKKLVSKAYKLRALLSHQSELNLSFGKDYYKPRNYLDFSVDDFKLRENIRCGITSTVQAISSAIPSETCNAEWQLTYRKFNNANTGSLRFVCQNSEAGEGFAQAVILIKESLRVINVIKSDVTTYAPQAHLALDVSLPEGNLRENLTILIKFIPK